MAKACTLVLKDEVNCKFEGLDPSTRRLLCKELTYFLPYARHTPAFKMGRWDGTKKLCTIGGSTYINLLDRLLPILVKMGYEIEIQDERKIYSFDFPPVNENIVSDILWPKGHPAEGSPIILRDYQCAVVENFLNRNHCLQEVATGAGKTVITATLSKLAEPYGRTIVIVPSKSLVRQTEEDYINLGLDVGVYFGDRKEWNKKHVICTWQSLDRIYDHTKLKKIKDEEKLEQALIIYEELKKEVAAVIVDEVHMAKADQLKMLLTGPFASVPLRWGLTGTIPKEAIDKDTIFASLGPVVNRVGAHELQERGILSNVHINVLQLKDSQVHSNYHDELAYLVSNKERMQWIANRIVEISKTGNTLVLLGRVKTGEMLEDMIPGSIFISGATGTDDRKEQFDEVSVSDNKLIFATDKIAAVGINIPRIFNLVLLEPGKSFIKVIQSIGRGLRKAKDKDFVNVYDITSSCKFSKRHLTERKKYYKEAKYNFTIEKINWE